MSDIVGRIRAAFPAIGSARIANLLARAGLHLARTTVRRFLQARANGFHPVPAEPSPVKLPAAFPTRRIISRRPDHTWLADLTVVPTGLGFWVPWLPFAFVQRWPFCWWIAVIVDHLSRAVVHFAVFRKEPTGGEVCKFFDRAVKRGGRAPKYAITDKGVQFGEEYRAWCKRRGVRPRFGAIGKTGSIAVTERLVLTLKSEGLRRIFVPFAWKESVAEVQAFVGWYNAVRPHTALGGATPNELRRRVRPARDGPRFETRPRYPTPRGRKLRAKKGTVLRLCVGHHRGRSHLPVIRLRVAA